MNIRQSLAQFELSIRSAGTSEGASKGWDSRGRDYGQHGSDEEVYNPNDEKNRDRNEPSMFYNVGDVVKNEKGRVGTVVNLNYKFEGNVLVKSGQNTWESRADNLSRHGRVN